MSQETGEQQQGGQCGCVQIFMLLAFVAAALKGGFLGFQYGLRQHGWWGGLLGATGGTVAGAVAGVLAASLVVAVVGLLAFGLAWLEERPKRPREES